MNGAWLVGFLIGLVVGFGAACATIAWLVREKWDRQ